MRNLPELRDEVLTLKLTDITVHRLLSIIQTAYFLGRKEAIEQAMETKEVMHATSTRKGVEKNDKDSRP